MAKKSFVKKLSELLSNGVSVEFISICGGETFYAYLDNKDETYGYGKSVELALDMVHTTYFINKETSRRNEMLNAKNEH